MALTLDDILAAPSDPVALNQHLQQRGLIPLAPPPAPGLPAANIGTMSPVTPRADVAPMKAPDLTREAGAPNVIKAPGSPDWLARETSEIKPLVKPTNITPAAAPEVAGATPTPLNTAPVTPMAQPTLTHAEKMALPLSVPGVPIGSAAYTEGELARLQEEKNNPWGSAENHPGLLGKIGHGLARAGEVAADVLAPGLTQAIPGTPESRGAQANILKHELATRTAAEGQEENRKSEEAARDVQTAEGKARLAKMETEQSLEKDAQGNVTGWKGPDGKLHSLDEEGTPQAIKDIAEASKSKQGPQLEKTANGDIVQITTDKDGKATSQVVYHGDPKVETDLTSKTIDGQEHRILVNKSNGEMIKDLGAFKTEQSPAGALKQEQADEEPVIAYDKDGNQKLVPRKQAQSEGLAHIVKASPKDRADAEQNTSVLNDMGAKIKNLYSNRDALDQSAYQVGLIKMALSGGPNDFKTVGAIALMSEKSKAYVQDVFSLREAALALPKQLTGGARVSEIQAKALWNTIPGVGGDSKYAEGQLKRFDQNLGRLWKKVPLVEGNEPERPQFEGPPGPPAAGMKWQQNKKTGEYRQVPANK